MLVFQLQRQKKGEEGLTDMQKQFLAAAAEGGLPLPSGPKEFASQISEIAKQFRDHGLSDFISTLTPGAQNAIYAASFAWGYENAARYVRSAMKLSEVKDAGDSEERSRALVENMVKQASSHSEKDREVSRAVWGFYNEDMKETQVQTARSETVTERENDEKVRAGQGMQMPQSAPEAVAMGVSGQSLSPVLLYCTAAEQAIEQQQARRAEEQKRGEMAKLVSQGAAGREMAEKAAAEGKAASERAAAERKSLEEKLKADSMREELAQSGVSAEMAAIAMQRQQELLRELDKAEKEISRALLLLDRMKTDEEEKVRRMLSSTLSPSLSFLLLRGKKPVLRKLVVKRQLKQWLAFCSCARAELGAMPAGRLIKLLSISKLFRS